MKYKVIAFAVLFLGAAFAKADVYTTFTSAAAFGGNDTLSWGQLGPSSLTTIYSSGTTATTANGLHVTVTDTGGFQRRDEGPGWFGNFTIGDQLLWDQGGGPVTFTFSQGISGIGFNLANNSYGAFTATLTTSDGTPFVFSGTSSGNEDGSAPFVGIKDLTGANIASLRIATSDPGANDFAFNRLLLVDAPGAAPTPEPSSFLLLGSGLMGLAGMVRAKIAAQA